VFTGPGPTRHDRPVVPPARHDPYKNNHAGPGLRQPAHGPARPNTTLNRAGPGLRQPAHGPARPSTTLNRAGLGLTPLVPGPAGPGPGRPGTARWTCISVGDVEMAKRAARPGPGEARPKTGPDLLSQRA
jgi:hypothetical protein